MITRISLIVFYIIVTGAFIFAQDIQFIETIPISQEECLIEAVDGIVILPDGSFIICDTRAGDFKIFDKYGKLRKVFGRRGEGPDEFSSPILFDYSDSKMLINDHDKDRMIIYQIDKELNFLKKDEFLGACFDAKICSDGYLLSGSKADKKGNWYEVFMKKSFNKDYSFLLTDEEIYDLPPKDSLLSNKNGLKERVNLGVRAYCDCFGNHVYAIWEGRLSIIRVDLKTMRKTQFGEKTSMYITPTITEKLSRARRERNLKEYYRELNKYSMVRKVFVSNKYIGVVYMNYDSKADMLNPIVQMYSLDGRLLKEKKLDNVTYPHRLISLYFDKNKSELSALSMTIDEQSEPHYILVKYGIK